MTLDVQTSVNVAVPSLKWGFFETYNMWLAEPENGHSFSIGRATKGKGYELKHGLQVVLPDSGEASFSSVEKAKDAAQKRLDYEVVTSVKNAFDVVRRFSDYELGVLGEIQKKGAQS